MNDLRNEFLADSLARISPLVNDKTMKEISRILEDQLSRYTIEAMTKELVVADTESERLLKRYIATKRVEGRSQKTLERYDYILRQMLAEIGIPTSQIDVFALRMYLGMLAERGCKDSTINGIRSIICAYFRWLTDSGFLQVNPAVMLMQVKVGKEVRKPYSATELEKLRECCENDRDRAILEFLLATGCRVSEVVGLNIDDINFQKHECVVLGKGNKQRTVFMSDACMFYLDKYLKDREDYTGPLFIGRRGERLTDVGFRNMLKRLEQRSGVENVHPHRFRRTCATGLINRGMTVQDVAAILGHSSISTTMRYVYSDTAQVKAAYEKAVR